MSKITVEQASEDTQMLIEKFEEVFMEYIGDDSNYYRQLIAGRAISFVSISLLKSRVCFADKQLEKQNENN